MNTPDDRALAAEVESAVRAGPGVTALYRSGSLVSNAIDAGARLLGIHEDAPFVRLARVSDDTLQIELAIGVHGAESSAVTAQRAYDAIEALLVSGQASDADIRLTVVHVGDAAGG